MKTQSLIFTLLMACLAFTACSQEETATVPVDADLERPVFGKADDLRGVQKVKNLGPDEAVEHAFTERFQFFGFPLRASNGSVLDIEVTQRGSSRGLDTTMFLYGQVDGDWKELIFDDNDGWGALSKITNFEVRDNFSELMVVIGTPDAQGLGNFRLAVDCIGGSCDVANLDEGILDTCQPSAQQAYEDCVYEELSEYAPGDNPDIAYIVDYCSTKDSQEWVWNNICDNRFNSPEDYCVFGFEPFYENMTPSCTEAVKESFGVGPVLPLSFETMPEQTQDALDNYECDFSACSLAMELLSYDTEEPPSMDALMGSARQRHYAPYAFGSGRKISVETLFDTYLDDVTLEIFAEALLPALDLTRDDITEVGQLGAEIPVAAGASDYVDILVIHFEAKQLVVTITSTVGEE